MNEVDKNRLEQLRSYGTMTREQADEYVELVQKERHPVQVVHVSEEVVEVKEVKSKKR